jgi:hypothetical protein
MPNFVELNQFNTHSFSLQSVGVSAQIQTLGHQSPTQISNGGPKSSCSGKSHPLEVHSVLPFLIPILDFFLYLFLIGSIH